MGYEAHFQPTDAELAIAARGGDCTCLGVLLERHRARLYAAALRVLGFRPEAEDAVYDTFLIALRHIGDLKDPQAIVGWLHMQDIDIAVYLLVIKLAPFRASGFIDWYNVEFQPRRGGRPLSGNGTANLYGRNAEGFRVPSGVRKPLMQEPAVSRR